MTKNKMTIEDKIQMVRMSIRAITRGYKFSRMVIGQAGVGKTYAVEEELKSEQEKLTEEYKTPFRYVFVTGGVKDALSFYILLCDNNSADTIIILDDINTILTNKDCREILRAAAAPQAERTIHYLSSNKVVRGKTFYHTKTKLLSKVIVITNIPKRKIDPGILSRMSPIEIEATPREMFDWIGINLEKAPPAEMPFAWKEMLYEFIRSELPNVKHMDFRIWADCCLWVASCMSDDNDLKKIDPIWKQYVLQIIT